MTDLQEDRLPSSNADNIELHFNNFISTVEKVKQLEQVNKNNLHKENIYKQQEKLISSLEESDRALRLELENLKYKISKESELSLKLAEKEKEISKLSSVNSNLVMSQQSMHNSIKVKYFLL